MRWSVGRETTEEDIDRAVKHLARVVKVLTDELQPVFSSHAGFGKLL
jgi:cysteine sulfinate desulfinase/cysteine desulfurase-like protein